MIAHSAWMVRCYESAFVDKNYAKNILLHFMRIYVIYSEVHMEPPSQYPVSATVYMYILSKAHVLKS